jgi:DsbC/DsbD-like thiol-disulfide interchange protein
VGTNRIAALFALLVGLLFASAAPPAASETASAWVDGYNSRARLIAGRLTPRDSAPHLMAGIEIGMPAGWKTYWRTPGDGGGFPPRFDWTGSRNLGSAEVLYPAPRRLSDPAGDAVGYTGSIVFPVKLSPRHPSQPIELSLALEYGICRAICIPAEAKLALSIPAHPPAAPAALATAADAVPRPADRLRREDPRLGSAAAELTGKTPRLTFSVEFPAGPAGADLFIEAPGGLSVPLPKKTGENAAGLVEFDVDLTQIVDPEALNGKTLRLTLVSEKGSAEASWTVK